MATEEYGLAHSRLLDLLEPPPPPKVEDDEDEEPEEEEEEEGGAPKGPPPAPQLVAQREVREQRMTLEARQAELKNELSEAIKRDDERAAAAKAAEERAARKAERAAARAAAIEAGEEPEEDEEEEEEEDDAGEGDDAADDEDDEDAEAPPPERTQDEIRADIDTTFDAWRSALSAESDASIVCVGLQAANKPRPGPVRCTFDAAYVEGKDQVWATARLDVDPAAVESESARCTDLLVVLDTTPSMEQHLHLLKRSLYDLLRSMESTDRLCIVGVSYKAQLLLDWTSTDGEGKAECRAAIRDITTRGGSKICPSGMGPILDHVMRALGKARPKAVPTGVWLCASPFGAPDERYDLRRSFSGSLRAAVAANFSATMSTVGVGPRSDSAMLSKIAEAGRGTFLYVPDCIMLSEHLGRTLASSRTTAASHVHAIVEGASPVSLVEVELGYGLSSFNAKAAGRKSTFFRSGKVTTVDLGPLRALQSRVVHFKVQLPNGAAAGKMSKQTPLARVVIVYATGETNVPNVHSASLRVADVPRLCARKPSDGGTRIRFCFSNPNEEFNSRPFQEALAQRLGVKNAMVPVDKVTHHREFHSGQSIVDMRIAKLSAEATSGVLTRVQQMYDAGELHAIANGEPKEDEETKDQGPEQGGEEEEEEKDDHPEQDEAEVSPAQPALELFLRAGYDTMQRAVQCATAQLLRARAGVRFGLDGGDSPEGVKLLQSSEKALARIVDMAELAAVDPAGGIKAASQVELAVPSDRSQSMLALSSSHRMQHASALTSCPGVDAYVTPAARKMGDSFAVSQCDREEMPLQMTTPTVEVVSTSTLQVSWEQPEVYSGPTVESYALTMVTAATGRSMTHCFAAPRSSCCIDGLEPGFYFVSMTASNGKRSSPSTGTAVCAVPAEPSPELVAAPMAVNVEIDGARWRWYSSLGAWDRVPSTDDNGVWPARVTKAQRLRDSVPDSPTWRVAPSSSSSIDVDWDAADGNGGSIEAYILLLVSAAGEQSTFRFSGKVREARICDRAPGSYSACLVACTAERTGAISDPVSLQISEEEDEEPAQAVAYYEFTLGGTTHTRAM